MRRTVAVGVAHDTLFTCRIVMTAHTRYAVNRFTENNLASKLALVMDTEFRQLRDGMILVKFVYWWEHFGNCPHLLSDGTNAYR